MEGKVLFIGAGAMGGALLRGGLQRGVLQAEQVLVNVKSQASAEAWQEKFGLEASCQLSQVLKDEVRTIILAVKPQVMHSVLEQLKDIAPGTVLISLATGILLEDLEASVPQAKWFRAMPNTPLAVGAGMTALAEGKGIDSHSYEEVAALFEAVGKVVKVSQEDLDRLSALAGAGPGYMFVILDALADAGVRLGLSRKLAIEAAAQTMYGAGLMAIETGQHPAVLRDQVTSPGGTTIAGIAAMEKGGLRSALQDGVLACYKRSNELGNKHK